MRHQAFLDDLRHVDTHDHVAWRGADDSDLERAGVDAFTTGMSTHERMMYIAEDPAPDRLAALPEVDAMLDRGDLLLGAEGGREEVGR